MEEIAEALVPDVEPGPQALTGVLWAPLSRLMTPPLPYPGLNNVLVGFAPAGRAGNASERSLEVFLASDTWEETRDGTGEGRANTGGAAHGVAPGLEAPTRLPDPATPNDNGGKGLLLEAEPQLPCLPTAERDDCAVELFNFKTLEPPCAAEPLLNESPLEPGRDG